MLLCGLLYVLGALGAWYLTAGWFYSSLRAMSLGAQLRREDHGMAVATVALYAAIWPVGVALAWFLTGYAEHGCWRDPSFPNQKSGRSH